ncbi:tyrosine kinase receptor Cad96Ca [Tetranychus urticae]|uniref:Protein kinase domain-containing protein n=1 Tax=Tetranychus urticae TaxID=32264 RepID=T1KJS9_TETUR|nr:tyrosine kinase receptor Cad96Ca [Tetranychus urticae]XP_025017149.1 tyrosine kinase receptor Cad96Ca [Tetranychus urticae]
MDIFFLYFPLLLLIGLSEQDDFISNGSRVFKELKLIPLDAILEETTSSSVRLPEFSETHQENDEAGRSHKMTTPLSSSSSQSSSSSSPTPSTNIYNASTKIYIVAIIGIVPAILGGLVYWLNYFRKSCFKTKRKAQEKSAMTSKGWHGNYIRPYRYEGKDESTIKLGSDEMMSIQDEKDLITSPIVRKKRTYSIEYPRHNLELLDILGEGNFGQVWKARITHFREISYVAVKTNKPDCGDKDWEDLLQELDIMLKLDKHPNVVRLLACCTDKVPYYLIMEYVEHGKLLNYIRQYRKDNRYYNDGYYRFTIADLILFSYHIAKGMEFISSYGIIHRDLAARNILISKDRVCKVADFGLARNATNYDRDGYEQKTRGAMPIRWMAPESLSLNIFTAKSDVWSFGILLWEIVTLGSTPYPGLTAGEVVKNVREGYVMERPPVRWCNSEVYNLMKACWSNNPSERPNFTQIKLILGQMLSSRRDYVDLSDFQSGPYYNIMYSSPGEKV